MSQRQSSQNQLNSRRTPEPSLPCRETLESMMHRVVIAAQPPAQKHRMNINVTAKQGTQASLIGNPLADSRARSTYYCLSVHHDFTRQRTAAFKYLTAEHQRDFPLFNPQARCRCYWPCCVAHVSARITPPRLATAQAVYIACHIWRRDTLRLLAA